MKTLVIVAHPQLANSSTESFLKAAADDENNVMWHELKTNERIYEFFKCYRS